MKYLLLCILLFTIGLNLDAQTVKINEVQSANTKSLADEDGDYSDWIEIRNTSASAINLGDYSISDDEDGDERWQFPTYTLQPGAYSLLFASGKDRPVAPSFWTTIINQGDYWNYLVPQAEVTNWNQPDFDDSDWQSGKSGFGYGDNDDSTIVSGAISIYLRKEFSIEDLSAIEQLLLHLDYDDGFVAYLNGTEIARSNLGTAGDTPAYSAYATIDKEALMYQGLAPDSFNIESFASLLHEGTNLLAIEVHNNYASSSDLTAIPFLSVRSSDFSINQAPEILALYNRTGHTDFKLSADGDSLFLFNAGGEIVSNMLIPSLGNDITYGYREGDDTKLWYFKQATPWLANTSEGLLKDENLLPVFSVAGGLYDHTFALELTATNPTDTVYYTTDGSDPDELSLFYYTPLQVDTAVTVKARIIKGGYLAGDVVTNSYFPAFNKSLPVVFLSTQPENLWDYNTGIYTSGPNAQASFPYKGANFWMDWEKPVHAEFYFTPGQTGFALDAGFKVFGNYSRGYEQKSLALYARSEYGPKHIKGKLFDNKALEEFDNLVLRSGGSDSFGEVQSWGTIVRDLFLTGIGLDMKLDAQAGRPCVVYLNSDYWGIYNIREKVNEDFLADNNGIDKDEIDLLEYDGTVVEGSNENYVAMLNFIDSNDLSVTDNYNYITTQMDVDNFIRYNVVEQYAHNTDWPGNNIKFWRQQGSTGKWRWILYDVDATFGIWYFDDELHTNSIALALDPDNDDWPNPAWSTFLLRSLMNNQGFKNRFINTFADHLNTTFLPDSVVSRITGCEAAIEDEISTHAERWGGYEEQWEHNISRLKTFALERPAILREFILEQFSLSDSLNVQLAISGCDEATVQLNTILLQQFPWTGIYFKDVPIELTAIAPVGYRFVRWEGDVQSTDANITVSMDQAKSITAVFEEDASSKNIVISEIMYHASDEYDSDDWVELYNNSSNYVNLTNWILKDSDDSNEYNFNANTIMGPYEYLVVCRNTENFHAIYPDVTNYQGSLGFGFSSSGECIRLYNTTEELIDQVCYASEYPWPTEPDGEGNSLILRNAEADNSLAQNWFSSASKKGSPGVSNTVTAIDDIEKNDISNFELKNYPNPFNQQTTIEFGCAEKTEVSLCIFNMQGQLQELLFSGTLAKGQHLFDWNAANVPSGIYLARLSSGQTISYLKLIVEH
ncbi:CotH kinase family protein [Mangrovibacterium diazotrophicum]|uniref:Putative secreted protein (Por secretion system target) n=1 Tax=Mangrovibacterium diazotrophicum TaxID=1261403 RepID=A0A419W5J0_9BACT|nr:CotH kinase family protein [Mangrovibacterium diazotrophicum]RKD90729.1 putative secreted protein (Por secretion system target) [Mangrovibacterium diazotrophicum]